MVNGRPLKYICERSCPRKNLPCAIVVVVHTCIPKHGGSANASARPIGDVRLSGFAAAYCSLDLEMHPQQIQQRAARAVLDEKESAIDFSDPPGTAPLAQAARASSASGWLMRSCADST